ncbi:hypothetical protein ABZY68_25375 [Streptomyces sp. NPDC006482]|uniref:hypothetical protein n=1 Tax=Streptomyces sp. NPDC006482 TaxID=3154306 RepID=UPI0033A039B9
MAVVPASREAEPEAPQAAPVVHEMKAYRPQPFTPDLIPEPEELDARGPMTDEELVELAYCEAAYANADKADWIKWMAAEAVRNRKTHRGPDGTRTWPEYCDAKFGESESEVNRSIQQWRLKRAIVEQQTTRMFSTPSSHVQTLLPIVAAYGGEDEVARNYVAMRTWAAENKVRVTAADLESWVQRAQAVEKPAERPALTGESLLEVREERVRLQEQAEARKAARKAASEARQTAPEPEAVPETHPNLGESPEATAAPEGHPNLGDQAPEVNAGAGDGEQHQAPETGNDGTGAGEGEQPEQNPDPLAQRAQVAASTLEGMSEAFVTSGLLRHASPETLKTIVETALSLAEAAEAELASR